MTRTALIIGSAGLVAPALAARLAQDGWRVLRTSRTPGAAITLDLASPGMIDLPDADAVFLIAAMTSQGSCELEPALAHQVNSVAPARIAQRYAGKGASIVALSTNLVFDGKTAFVDPHAQRNPQSVYGSTKAALEEALLGLDGAAILRITKIAQSLWPLVDSWAYSLQNRQPIAPFSDYFCAPVRLRAVVEIIAHIADIRATGIFQHSGSWDVSYSEIANRLCDSMRVSRDLVRPIRAAGSPLTVAMLPANTTLKQAIPSEIAASVAAGSSDVWSDVFGSGFVKSTMG
jgi:dTDP-4-dehydrorhamnose reductase